MKNNTNIEKPYFPNSPLWGAGGLEDIISSLKHNKLRTILTGLAVAWGIFILIVLLGAGNGLRNGVMSNFAEISTNYVEAYTGWTSMPYKGMKAHREMKFSNKEIEIIEKIPEADKVNAVISTDQTISFGNEYGNYQVRGVQPVFAEILCLKIAEGGRFINELDIKQQNKVVVIDKRLEESLFKNENCIGKHIKIGSLMFRVVGVFTKKDWRERVYIPFSTAQTIYNPDKKFWWINFNLNGVQTTEENEAFNKRLKTVLAKSLNFNPDDPQGVWIWNMQQQYIQTQKIFGAINIFVGIIGIFTLIAGIVGISNIMLVSVRERTREFGIRKAIGAPPASILWSVILEAVMITAIFGYIGLVCGVGVTEAANWILSQQNANPNGMTIFKNPTIGLNYAFIATFIMIISGAIAGYIPARKAVKIKPIEAMKEV